MKNIALLLLSFFLILISYQLNKLTERIKDRDKEIQLLHYIVYNADKTYCIEHNLDKKERTNCLTIARKNHEANVVNRLKGLQ